MGLCALAGVKGGRVTFLGGVRTACPGRFGICLGCGFAASGLAAFPDGPGLDPPCVFLFREYCGSLAGVAGIPCIRLDCRPSVGSSGSDLLLLSDMVRDGVERRDVF